MKEKSGEIFMTVGLSVYSYNVPDTSLDQLSIVTVTLPVRTTSEDPDMQTTSSSSTLYRFSNI